MKPKFNILGEGVVEAMNDKSGKFMGSIRVHRTGRDEFLVEAVDADGQALARIGNGAISVPIGSSLTLHGVTCEIELVSA